MFKYSTATAIVAMLALGAVDATPARAAQGVVLPGGDALDFTPPGNITEQQVQAAPRRDRRKVRAIQNGSYTPMRKRSRKIGVVPARGQ